MKYGLIMFIMLTFSGFGLASVKEDAIREFAKIPVLEQGRYKPWDSVARNSLLMIYERQELKTSAGRWSAIQWLTELLFDAGKADQRQIFRVMHPDVRVLLGNTAEDQKFFSFSEITAYMSELSGQANLALQVEAQLRNSYQRAIVSLSNHVALYQGLKRTLEPPGPVTLKGEMAQFKVWSGKPLKAFHAQQKGETYNEKDYQNFLQMASMMKALSGVSRCLPVPPDPGSKDKDWLTVWDSLVQSAPRGEASEVVRIYGEMGQCYREGDWKHFKEHSVKLNKILEVLRPEVVGKSRLETAFNRSELFYRTSVLYVFLFLIVMISWVKWRGPLGRIAFWLVILAFVLHTSGLVIRMLIQGRPPVTNLYSSALFVGWGGAVMGIVLERMFKNGIGVATASMLGFLSLVVAHNLAGDGDTMAMLQAVLDTNFWLATHVVMITFGYSATFFSGFLAILYIVLGFFTKLIDEKRAEALERMVFGIVCFALLFSFVGTVLGGIWADQSWGRFWGWDPKENGALLIVLWNAIILHARWGGMIGRQKTMVAAVFGNMVTAWSWFGTNMLGVGLHSYGFMDRAFFWLVAFGFFMLMIMGVGLIPAHLWDSFADREKRNLKAEG